MGRREAASTIGARSASSSTSWRAGVEFVNGLAWGVIGQPSLRGSRANDRERRIVTDLADSMPTTPAISDHAAELSKAHARTRFGAGLPPSRAHGDFRREPP